MQHQRHHGAALVYSIVAMSVMILFTSLGADWARVQLVKTEMQRAAFAAARAGAGSLPGGSANARSAARDQVALNLIDGTTITVDNADLIVGKWIAATKTIDTTAANPDAVRVVLRRVASRGTGVETFWAGVFGHRSVDVTAQSTAVYISPVDITSDIPATANPWLAGMPPNTVANAINPHNNPDWSAGTPNKASASPVFVPLTIVPGTELTFGSVSGYSNNDVNYDPNVNYSPDGNFGWNVNNRYAGGAEHGIGDLRCPINAIVGVFLSDDQPDITAAPPSRLEFANSTARDFSTLTPQLKQPFFIGDGLRNDGRTVQRFVIPPGATRFYLAQMDEYEWNNNRGVRTFKISRPGQVQTVE